MEKLKANNKYDDYKKKKVDAMKKLRAKRKQQEKSMTANKLAEAVAKRRAAGRERSKKYRDRAKKQKENRIESQSEANQSSCLSELVCKSYNCTQTLAKAVKKVSSALPASPRKKRAILTHIVANMDEDHKQTLVSVVTKPKSSRKSVSSQLTNKIREFFGRDDISRISPKTRDVKKYKCPETGEEVLFPTRHMTMSIREAFSLFAEERQKANLGMSNWKSCLKLFFISH